MSDPIVAGAQAPTRTHWGVILAAYGAGVVGAFQIGKMPSSLPDIRADRQAVGDGFRVKRLGGGEDQRLGHAHMGEDLLLGPVRPGGGLFFVSARLGGFLRIGIIVRAGRFGVRLLLDFAFLARGRVFLRRVAVGAQLLGQRLLRAARVEPLKIPVQIHVSTHNGLTSPGVRFRPLHPSSDGRECKSARTPRSGAVRCARSWRIQARR